MARVISYFVCQKCGSEFSKWSGQCQQCGEWNSLIETAVSESRLGTKGKRQRAKRNTKPLPLGKIETFTQQRIKTGIGELDRVLGGGIVPGSIVLVAGEPGIGKSTMLTQLALRLAALAQGKQVLYVCGEESPTQIKMRIDRIKATDNPIRRGQVNKFRQNKQSTDMSANNSLLFLAATDIDEVIANINAEKPNLVIIDSIQTMLTADLKSASGSISQVSECTNRLTETAKKSSIPIFLVGHVTKEGMIAGPKVLEHIVDVVLELSGDRLHEFRLLRANKNRFGATDEVGIFSLDEYGMTEISNPSDRFLEDRQKGVPGSAVVCVLEGTRPVLVEIQALTVASQLAIPRRIASGVDQRRVQLLVAVLSKRCGLKLADKDVYVNVAGGLAIREPASDFGICLAIASSYKNLPLPRNVAVIGEVGLLGEIRKVGRLKQRIAESKAQGFNRLITAQEYASLPKAIFAVLR